jgi:hypothetical protein
MSFELVLVVKGGGGMAEVLFVGHYAFQFFMLRSLPTSPVVPPVIHQHDAHVEPR